MILSEVLVCIGIIVVERTIVILVLLMAHHRRCRRVLGPRLVTQPIKTMIIVVLVNMTLVLLREGFQPLKRRHCELVCEPLRL